MTIQRIIEAWLHVTLGAVLFGVIAALVAIVAPVLSALIIAFLVTSPIVAYSIVQSEEYHKQKAAHTAQQERIQRSLVRARPEVRDRGTQ